MNIYEGITRNLKHQQLINNIESVVWGYVNGMNDDPENYKPLTKDQLVKYCYEEIFDIKDDGEGTTQMQKGICDDLKFLGTQLIRDEILRIGEEAGVLAKDVKNESEDDFDTFCEENHELIDNTYNEVMANAQDISVEEFIAKDEPVNIREWERIAKDVYEDSKFKNESDVESHLSEDEGTKLSPEEIVADSWNHIVNELGKEPTIDNILDDILNCYNQDYFKDDTVAHINQAYIDVKEYLRRLGLEARDLNLDESINSDKEYNDAQDKLKRSQDWLKDNPTDEEVKQNITNLEKDINDYSGKKDIENKINRFKSLLSSSLYNDFLQDYKDDVNTLNNTNNEEDYKRWLKWAQSSAKYLNDLIISIAKKVDPNVVNDYDDFYAFINKYLVEVPRDKNDYNKYANKHDEEYITSAAADFVGDKLSDEFGVAWRDIPQDELIEAIRKYTNMYNDANVQPEYVDEDFYGDEASYNKVYDYLLNRVKDN